jgi:hypothetical protein
VCYRDVFAEGVSCSSSNWSYYGSGAGYQFQMMAKNCPAFAIEVCALGLRNLRQHWGPINRYEVELLAIADAMLADVQEIVTPPSV